MKSLVEIKTGNVIGESTFISLHKNTVFSGLSEDDVNMFGYSIVLDDEEPDYDSLVKVLSKGVVEKRGNRWYQTWIVVNRPDAANRVREERNKLLAESDWTQVADAPVDATAWATYRQALRDVTSQECFPHNVVWPTKP